MCNMLHNAVKESREEQLYSSTKQQWLPEGLKQSVKKMVPVIYVSM